jgi:hypothetical protein
MTTNKNHNFAIFIQATAQELDTKTHNNTANLLRVSTLPGHLQGAIRQRKAQHWLIMS